MDNWQGNERRKDKDIWVVIFQRLSLIGWVAFIFALILSFFAAPEKTYGITRYHNITVKDYWSSPLTDYLYILLWFTALFSLASIIASHFRTRRSTDNKYYNLLLLMVICIAWVVYITINAYW